MNEYHHVPSEAEVWQERAEQLESMLGDIEMCIPMSDEWKARIYALTDEEPYETWARVRAIDREYRQAIYGGARPASR